jgi:hypothetical protein
MLKMHFIASFIIMNQDLICDLAMYRVHGRLHECTMGTRVYIEVPEVREATGRGRSPSFRNSQSKVEVIIFTFTLALRLVHYLHGCQVQNTFPSDLTCAASNDIAGCSHVVLLQSTLHHPTRTHKELFNVAGVSFTGDY